MIKNYLELSKAEIDKVYEFMNRNVNDKHSPEEMDKQFRDEIYDSGRGVIFKFHEGNVIGKVLIILEECSRKGIAYIVSLDIGKDVANKRVIVNEILNKANGIAKNYGAYEIYMGTGNEEIIKILNSLNMYKQYSAVKMILRDRKIKCTPFDLIPLCEENKDKYLEIYNNAFKEVPHGATLTEKDIDKNIKIADDNNHFFIVTTDNKGIGFLQCKIDMNMGEFDIGLVELYRGKGYGKRLLETAIDFLNLKNVDEIYLTIITKNTLAYNMYKKRGFKESKLLSDWFILSD